MAKIIEDKSYRIAVVDPEKCKPNKCNKECERKCPVNHIGKECVVIEKVSRINEDLCTGCGICVKVCPFSAIKIYKLPTEIKSDLTHSYGENSFKLYKMLVPKINTVQGIIGSNGVGKSTLINIMGDKLNIDTNHLLNKYKGTELFKYLKKLYDKDLIIKIKHQNIDMTQKYYQKKFPHAKVCDELGKYYKPEFAFHQCVYESLEIDKFSNNTVGTLSGGEMQKLCIAATLLADANVYIFDEFTNHLDVHQRLLVANLIQNLKELPDKYIFVIDHDLSILDYTCDTISIIHGKPGAYGIISNSYPCSDAINMFFNGYIQQENMRFRDIPFSFRSELEYDESNIVVKDKGLEYEDRTITYPNLTINISGSSIIPNGIYVILGKNGTGKSTFLNYISKDLIVSYKTQYVTFEEKYYGMTVRDYLYAKIRNSMCNALFLANIKTFIETLYDKEIDKLSGGEAQKVAIVECIGTDADVYLLDEPSANLDIEQRFLATKLIKRFLLQYKKVGFIVEHDIMMAIAFNNDAYNSRIILVDSEDNVSTVGRPCDYGMGINCFLKSMDVTFRTEIKHKRPRINKKGSQKDQQQKEAGKYYI